MKLLKRIFSITNKYTKTKKYKVINILGIKIKFSCKYEPPQGADTKPIEYLKKYLYVLNKPIETEETPDKELKKPIIWQMWWQGTENAPDIVKTCLNRVKQLYPQNQIIITKDNYQQYIQLPDFILDKYKKGMIGHAQFSDIIRIFLLCKWGGTWIDSTCLLTEKIPQHIIDADIFYFKNTTWSQCPIVPSEEFLEHLIKIPTYLSGIATGSNWFIVAKPNNHMLKVLKNMLVEYWANEDFMVDYFIFHLMLTLIVLNDESAKSMYENMINLNNRNPHLLQKMLEIEFSQQIFNEIKQYSFIHKLRYKNLEDAIKNPKSFYNKILEQDL